MMYEGKPGSLFVRYAIPQMIGLLFNSVYIIVDGVFIGNCLGSDALAAAGVAVPVVEFLIALSMAVTSGAGVLVSGRLAMDDKSGAVQVFNTSMMLQGLLGIVIAVCGSLFVRPLARLLGATPQIMDMTVTYLLRILIFSPFLLFSYLLGGLVRNDGRPKLAMIALMIGSLSNILLDYIFMYPLHLGIGGAALATALGPVISCMLLLPHFFHKKGALYFRRHIASLALPGKMLRLGIPSFVMEFSIGMVTFFYNFGIVRYGFGELGLAAYLIIGYLMLIILTLFLGMAEGLQPVFSYLFVAQEKERLEKLRRISLIVFVAIGIIAYGLVLLSGSRFYHIFAPNDPVLTIFASERSIYYFSCFFAAGVNILMISYYQSTMATRKAVVLSSLRGWVLLAILILVLPVVLGNEALWICHSATELVTMLVTLGLKKTEDTRP